MGRRVLIVLVLLLVSLGMVRGDQQFSIVTPAWVAAHARDANVRILDVRNDVHYYFVGHVPTAVYMADGTIRGPKNGLPVQYLPPALLADLFSRAGVRNGQTVVVYTEGENVPGATMVAYALERLGLAKTAIIDGGYTGYQATQQTDQFYPSYTPEGLTVRVNNAIAVDVNQVRQLVGKPGVTFIDARPNNMYTGEVKAWMRNGHIPGAINIPWMQLMDANNLHQFKSVAELQALYDAKGVKKTDNIILYCGTSREASVEFQVLRHILGYPNVRLFEGAWNEYSSHPELPIQTGNTP